MSYEYRLMFVPSLHSDSYVLVTSRGDSLAVRHFGSPTEKPTLDRSRTLAGIGREPKRAGAPVLVEEPHSIEDLKHWWLRTEAANRRAGLGAGKVVAAVEASTRTHFRSHDGRELATLADWQALHPAIHWKAGYSAMELARSWQHADGLPPAVAAVLASGPFGPLVLDRAIAECPTSVPGAGRPSYTDLMVEAVDAAGGRVVIAVDAGVARPPSRHRSVGCMGERHSGGLTVGATTRPCLTPLAQPRCARILAPIRGALVAQVTIYIDEETEARTRAAANAAGLSLSRWISEALRDRTRSEWPPDVVALAGSWLSNEAEPSASGDADLPREPL